MRVLFSLQILSAVLGLVFAQQSSQNPPTDPYACSASQPCKIGCCGKNNVCGLGPDYCSAANCQNSCGAKSECDPGWGSQWSDKEKCPLNVCCSKYGFCGTTSEFCGNATVKSPFCTNGNSASQKIIGYYEGWSTTRSCKGINPEELLFGAYTHLNYAFAFIDPQSFAVSNMQASDSELMPRLTALKNYNPSLEVWISIGGWSMNDPDQPTHATFSILAGSQSAQQAFFKSLLSFMSTYGFDGVDIDWEYPVAPERSGNAADFQNYVSFLKNLRAALGSNGHKYGLSITLPSSYWYMQNFDIQNIAPLVDWFNVMTYDLHGTWDSTDPYIGAYVNAHTNLTEINLTLDLLWRNQIDPAKVVMGMGFYGRSFTLSDPSCSHAGCPFSGGGNPGQCSASAGTLMYSEIEDIIANGGANVVTDTDAAVKIVTWGGNQWVSYDDQTTLKQKMDYANGKCLGGVMVWAASTDDASGNAIQALAGASGRTNFSASILARSPAPDPGQCIWGECGANCPSGLTPVTSSSGNKDTLGIEAGCNQGSRYFCCPAKNPPKCEWKGSPKFCGLLSSRQCSDSEVEVAASTDGCWTGHKSLCCAKTGSDSTLASCKWYGAAPICSTTSALTVVLGFVSPLAASAFTFASYGCDSGSSMPIEQTTGKQGEGGQQSCSYNGGFKSYCCSNPSPWKKCNWKTGHTSWAEWGDVLIGALNVFTSFQTDCKTGCDPGQVTVATDSFACRSGTYSYYCCDNPNGAPSPPPITNVNLCPGPASLPGLNTEHEVDPDSSDNNVYIEVEVFDTTCTLPPYQSQPTRRDRTYATRPHHIDFERNHTNNSPVIPGSLIYDDDMFVGEDAIMKIVPYDHHRHLSKRAVRETAMSLCSPSGLQARLYPVSYPAHTSVLRQGPKVAWNAANQGVCAVAGVVGSTSLNKVNDYVTEHVFEKQEFRNAIEWMMKGVTPLGNTVRAGAAQFQGLFDDNGLFQQNWPANFPRLAKVQTYAGNIADSFMGLLGRTADPGLNNANLANLQVCDADYNRYKEFIVAGVDFIGKSNWAGYTNRLDRVGILTDVVDTMAYRAKSAVVTSYSTTYDDLSSLWDNFGSLASQNGISYNFKDAFQQIIADNLKAQVSATQSVFTAYLKDEITWWNSNAALQTYSPTVVADIKQRLADFLANSGTYISLPVNQMTT